MCSHKILVKPGFVLLCAVLILFGDAEVLVPMLLASLIHELGHITALYLLGGRLGTLRLTASGACIDPEPGSIGGWAKEAVLCLAGPLANLLLAALCIPAVSEGMDLALFLGCNLLAGGFNLLPAAPFDGGQALFCILLRVCSPVTAERVLRGCTLAVALLLAAGGTCVFLLTGYNATALLCGLLPAGLLLRTGR